MVLEQQGTSRGRKTHGNCALHIVQKYPSLSILPSSPVAPGTRNVSPAEGPCSWVGRESLKGGSLPPSFNFCRVNPELVRKLMDIGHLNLTEKLPLSAMGSGTLVGEGSGP